MPHLVVLSHDYVNVRIEEDKKNQLTIPCFVTEIFAVVNTVIKPCFCKARSITTLFLIGSTLCSLKKEIVYMLSPYSTGNWVCVGYQTQMKSTQKNEMYIANVKILRWGPNATYIPLTCIRGWRQG